MIDKGILSDGGGISLLNDIKRMSNRLEILERQSSPSSTIQLADGVTEVQVVNNSYNDIGVFRQATAPTGLNASTEVGNIWYETDNNDAASWWDGFAWRSLISTSPKFSGAKDLSALGPAVLNQSLTNIYIYTQATAPTAPAFGWVWRDTSAGNAWITTTDGFIVTSTNAALDDVVADITDSRIRVYYVTALPGGMNNTTDRGNLAFVTNDGYAKYIWDGIAWIGINTNVTPTTDGVPPAYSATPIVVGGIGSFFIYGYDVPNSDPVMYDIHASVTPGFTHSNATLVTTTSSTQKSVRTKADGLPFLYDTDYYFKIVVRDDDGAALPSTQVGPVQLHAISNGDIAADYAYVGEVFANQIRSGFMSADVTISGSFSTAETGQRTVLDNVGWRQYGPDGVSVSNEFPNDPNLTARIRSIVQALTLTVEDGLELRGQNNVFAMGSKITLQATTSGSATGPGATLEYEQSSTDVTQSLFVRIGMYLNSAEGDRHSAGTFFGLGQIRNGSGIYNFPQVTLDNGSAHSTFNPYAMTRVFTTTGRSVLLGEVASNGLPVNSMQIEIRGYNDDAVATNAAPSLLGALNIDTFSFNKQYRLGRCFSPIASSTLRDTVAFARVDTSVSSNNLIVRRYTISEVSVVQAATFTVTAPWNTSSTDEKIAGICYGSSAKMGFHGADQNIWVVVTTKNVYVYNNTMSARITDLEFSVISGMTEFFAIGDVDTNAYAGFRTFAHDPITPMYKYTDISWPNTDSSVWWVGYTWFDNVGTTHETNLSAPSSITMKKRARLIITTPQLPDPAAGKGQPRGVEDVNSFRLYLGRGATQPLNTAFWKQSNQPADLATSIIISALPQFSGTSNPPTTTTFPSGAASYMISSAINSTTLLEKIKIDANGNAHFENLDVSGGGLAYIEKLILASTQDVTTSAGNQPALRVGSITGTHLRVDGNEIMAMTSDTATGTLSLNFQSANGVRLVKGDIINGITFGNNTPTTNASGDVTVAHGLGVNPTTAVAIAGTGHTLVLQAKDATNITFRCRNANTGAVLGTGVSVQVFWIAFA
jgi:hypothetical protein